MLGWMVIERDGHGGKENHEGMVGGYGAAKGRLSAQGMKFARQERVDGGRDGNAKGER